MRRGCRRRDILFSHSGSLYDAIRAADQGNGVACLYGNYAGDNMNVKMAIGNGGDDDIEVKIVVANDDVASAPKRTGKNAAALPGKSLCGNVPALGPLWAGPQMRLSR